jgi:hypothetical protein
MATRRGLLTLSDWANILGADDMINMPLILEMLPEINTLDLVYSTMLQAGIDQIELPSDEEEHESVSPFLKRHLVFRSGKEWIQAFCVVKEFFDYHLPSFSIERTAEEDNEDQDDVFTLYSFLIRLLTALSTGQNLINMGDFPDANRLTGKLPPEVLLLIKGLLDTFEATSPNSICPRMTVDRDNVALFQDLLVSQRYTQYKSAHSALEDPAIPTNISAEIVSQATKSLCAHTRKWTKGRKMLVSVLPFSAQIVDMIFGALPGKLAAQFARVTQDWLTRNQRLVIYQMSGVTDQILIARIDAYCRGRASAYGKSNPD